MPVRKRFGQHFLHDPGIIGRIINAVAPQPGQRIVEVGPGRGALTWGLLARAKRLETVEIDRDLAQTLLADRRARDGLTVHVQNVLDTDFSQLRGDGEPLRIVGNLPYNISTPLMFRLLDQRTAIADMHFMLQKEVVDRMASAGRRQGIRPLDGDACGLRRGRASVRRGPGAFQPRPKVWSAIVRLRPSPQPRFEIGSDKTLRAIVSAAFSHRRKTLRNGLKGLLSAEDIEDLRHRLRFAAGDARTGPIWPARGPPPPQARGSRRYKARS
jgi:16S rRNA (adenine1518-N6/adenine1519-N6)-dimethyltransferase